MKKLYPESGVELNPFLSRYYDKLMKILSAGKYSGFIKKAIADMNIESSDKILDFGCGTGSNACLMINYLSEEGGITGLDISEIMEEQFKKNCSKYPNAEFINQRIDIPFDLNKKYDKVFISFVLHGFPQNIRENIIRNAFNHLKSGGKFQILDFAEFDMNEMPFYYRLPFKWGECPYAFDFIKRDLKEMLKKEGFTSFDEKFYFKNYARLLTAVKG